MQVVLAEASHLVAALGEAAAPLAPPLVAVCWRALDHKEYSVRYEAATALASLLRALPHLAGPLLGQACRELDAQHAHLVNLATHGGAELPLPAAAEEASGRLRAAAEAKLDAERKKRAMFSLHGRATVVAVALQGVEGLARRLPPPLLARLARAADALVARRDDASLQTRDAMGVLCTCVRAGWALTTALLSVGADWTAARLPKLLLRWRAAVAPAVDPRGPGPAGLGSAFEPTHELVCLDAALHSVLGFVRLYPEVFFHTPPSRSATWPFLG